MQAASSPPRDAVAAVTHADPYPYYAALRASRPLFFDAGLSLWVASSAAAVTGALAHPGLRVRPPAEPVPQALLGTATGGVFSRLVRMTDGEFHRMHRPHVAASASRWDDGQIAEAARSAARELAPRLDANALLTAVPVRAMARLLGVAPGALDETTAAVLAFTQGIAGGAPADAIARANTAAEALMQQGMAEGLDEVRAANRIALMQQSVDATAALLGNSLLATRTHAGAWNPKDAIPFVAECARWDAPVHNTRRFAAQDLQWGGVEVQRGQGVLVVLASANRDAALNEAPERFATARANRRSLGFGAGAHACPGEALAIRIVAAALPVLLAEASGRFGVLAGYRPLPNARIPVFAG
ncbi:cytochrome P450 [Caenimonas aquaedulcis]|uniref:Cytochrome P450 n=1 Tax=Caenimonas aquaedulcis TaxID=2793270 RepID=A0A931H172_9BURK|nr:cytochrome P450 [Caenimonas aquaedulcis]MBG9386594.1 cytochrome P450 [Caenimonas aquaedulcis]